LSMPLAYPSALDRRDRVAHSGRLPSYVEGFWSPSLARWAQKGRLKRTLIHQRHFKRLAPRVFLSQAGPRFGSNASSSWASPLVRVGGSPPKRRKATRWVALDWLCYAASWLARITPSEG
jgi:hypothetical protein